MPTSEEVEEHSWWSSEITFAEAIAYGECINENYVHPKVMQFADVADRYTPRHCMASRAHRITTLPGTPLPFSWNLEVNVDLVVGDAASIDARDLLRGFDLTICTASFDGVKFRIPHPHLTFQRKSLYNPARARCLESFMAKLGDASMWTQQEEFGPPCVATKEAARAVRAVRAEGLLHQVGMERYILGIESHAIRQIRMAEDRAGFVVNDIPYDPAEDELVRFFCKLLNRLRHYANKGIEVEMEQMPSVKAALALPRFARDFWGLASQHEQD
jgi:hypothetical protein